MSRNINWEKVNFVDTISINPRESLKKRTLAKKVSMADIIEHTKKIESYSIVEYKSGTKFRQNDTLFARITPSLENGKTAKVNILDESELGFGSTEFIVMRAKPGITNHEFVYYLARWDEIRGPAIKSMTGTSGRQRVQNSIFEELLIDLPPLNEQIAIAKILSSFDDKIENSNAIIANLEEQAQTIFKSWFVDFEPFQDGEFIETEIGLIPASFETKELGSIYKLRSGYAFKSKDWDSEGSPVIKIKNIHPPTINLDNIDYISNLDVLEKADDFRVTGGEIIIALTGATTGKFGIVPNSQVIYVNQRAGLFFDDTESGYGYLCGLLNQKEFMNKIIDLAQGSAQANLSPRDVNNLLVPYNKSVFNKFNSIVNPLMDYIALALKENQLLANTRDTLLPKLMSGEIRVEEAIEVK